MYKFLIPLIFACTLYGFKIDRVILSTDSNPNYIQFWPIVAKTWKEHIGVKPTLALIADKSVSIDDTVGDVIRFEPIPGVKTSLHAQVIRLLLPAYFEDEVCIISDIDMIPLNKDYFFDSVRNVKYDCFVTYRNYFYQDQTTIYPMCYLAAKGKVFKEIFKVNNIFDIPIIIQNWAALNLGWSTDEILLLRYLRNWKDHKTRCVHLDQPITHRIDRLDNLACDLQLLKSGYYIDAHCLRPYDQHKEIINKILNAVMPGSLSKGKKADLVIFSYDRPMQLYALLESIEKHITNLGEKHIIYRVSNNSFMQAYNKVQEQFSSYKFHKQNIVPYLDFKDLVLQCSFDSPNDYIIYAVDDIIIKDNIDIAECIGYLQQTNVYGFYLRLGKNITQNYTQSLETPSPPFVLSMSKDNGDKIYKFNLNESKGDWSYPNSLDMTLYKKSNIIDAVLSTIMTTPNTFEGNWAKKANLNQTGLCFAESKIVNIPINICNELPDKNKSMKLYSTQELLERFNHNLRIDISKYYKVNNSAPHHEQAPEFIEYQ